MKPQKSIPQKFNSIAEAHRAFNLPKPLHPSISLIGSATVDTEVTHPSGLHILSFYKISYRPRLSKKLKYGQGNYDFDDGGLLFASPNQIIGNIDYDDQDNTEDTCSEYTLLIHPDFLLGYPLAKKIKQYGFFSYTANEALHLSETEKDTIISLFKMIDNELKSRIDDFSQNVVIAQIELMLNYADRFYKRQFITRKAVNHGLLQKLETVIDDYFNNEVAFSEGLPTVAYIAEKINLSPSYLSDMLRSLLGQNAQQYIHNKLIEKAKEKLSTTALSVSEIAYTLGFEHSQSFSKLFKAKTELSPLEFRRTFN